MSSWWMLFAVGDIGGDVDVVDTDVDVPESARSREEKRSHQGLSNSRVATSADRRWWKICTFVKGWVL